MLEESPGGYATSSLFTLLYFICMCVYRLNAY